MKKTTNLRLIARKYCALSSIIIVATMAASDAHAVYFGLSTYHVNVIQDFKEKRSVCVFLGISGCIPVENMHENNPLYTFRSYIGQDFYKTPSSRTSLEFGYYLPTDNVDNFLSFINKTTYYTWYRLHMMDLMLVHHQNMLKNTDLLSVFGKAGFQHSRLSSNSRYSQNNQIIIDRLSGTMPVVGIGIELKPWKHFSVDLSLDKRLQKLLKSTDKTYIKLDNNLNMEVGLTFHF